MTLFLSRNSNLFPNCLDRDCFPRLFASRMILSRYGTTFTVRLITNFPVRRSNSECDTTVCPFGHGVGDNSGIACVNMRTK